MPSMSAATKVACVDYGATGIRIQVLDVARQPYSGLVEYSTPPSAKEGFRRLTDELWTVSMGCGGFDATSVGFAAPIRADGRIGAGGNLTDWQGWDLASLLEREFSVPAVLSNDGRLFATVEDVFGVLAKAPYRGKSGMVVAPGSGVATCRFVWYGDGYHIFASEAQHMTGHLPLINGFSCPTTPKPCGCGRQCLESVASGRALEQGLTPPEQLWDSDVNAMLAPGLAALVTNLKVTLLGELEVVVMSGGIAHKRPALVPAVSQLTEATLSGFQPTPDFVLSEFPEGGLLGALANYIQQCV